MTEKPWEPVQMTEKNGKFEVRLLRRFRFCKTTERQFARGWKNNMNNAIRREAVPRGLGFEALWAIEILTAPTPAKHGQEKINEDSAIENIKVRLRAALEEK